MVVNENAPALNRGVWYGWARMFRRKNHSTLADKKRSGRPQLSVLSHLKRMDTRSPGSHGDGEHDSAAFADRNACMQDLDAEGGKESDIKFARGGQVDRKK